MEYGKADSYGNPFWLSAEKPVAGMSLQQMSQYCWDLTESERAAGRLPAGYRYVATQGTGGEGALGEDAVARFALLIYPASCFGGLCEVPSLRSGIVSR